MKYSAAFAAGTRSSIAAAGMSPLLLPLRIQAESSLLRLSHQRGSFPPPLLTAAGRRQPSVIATNSRFAPESLLAAATPLQDSSRRSAGRTSRLQRSSSPRQVFTSMLVGMDQDCVVPKDEMEKLAPLLQPLLDDIHSMMAKFRLDRLKST
ncbi:hypothetical protein EJB05_37897, partial [Eragrostis curvula]